MRGVTAGMLVAAVGIAVAVVASTPPAAASVTARGELVVNGDFDGGDAAPWWHSGNTAVSVVADQLRTAVGGGTANPYDAMIGQSGIALSAGRVYTLTFDASATSSLSIRVTVQVEAAPYTATLDQRIAVDSALKRYTLPFTSTLTTPSAAVTLQLGGVGAFTATLDNASLTPSPIELTSGFYVDPNSNPAVWVHDHPADPYAAPIRDNIATKPGARWFGNWSGGAATAVGDYVGAADAAGKLPVLVAYNITDRDCNGESSGGAGSPDEYRTWISSFASAIGNRPAIVVIEPDAVAQSTLPECMTGAERQTRIDLLRYATERFRDLAPNTWAYLDGGNAGWIGADTMAQALESAGVRNVRGFAVNVANYYTTGESTTYGDAVDNALNSRYGHTARYIVDTSRNGNGSNGDWCNPPNRKLGVTSQTGNGTAELLLWVKVPGDSDGRCPNGAVKDVPAGTFSRDLAMGLITG